MRDLHIYRPHTAQEKKTIIGLFKKSVYLAAPLDARMSATSLARLLLDEGEVDEVANLMQNRADNGDLEAAFILGEMHLKLENFPAS